MKKYESAAQFIREMVLPEMKVGEKLLQDGESWVRITVPEDGAAVIIAGETMQEALQRELNQ